MSASSFAPACVAGESRYAIEGMPANAPINPPIPASVALMRSRLTSGSYLVISHYSIEGTPAETIAQLERLSASAGSPSVSRTSEEVLRLFDGYELVEPGVVRSPLWRPESLEDILVEQPERSMAFCGAGRKQ